MPQPGDKGPAATFIGLGKGTLPKGVFIYHKFVRDVVQSLVYEAQDKAKRLFDWFHKHRMIWEQFQ